MAKPEKRRRWRKKRTGFGAALAIGTAIYGYGYAKGQQAGYRAKYGN